MASKHRKIIIISIIFSLIFTMGLVLVLFGPMINARPLNPPDTDLPLVPSADPVIDVDGNAELAAAASSGFGNSTHPFIIEDKVIMGGTDPCIRIKNTTDFFKIENCTVYAGHYGIYLWNVTNGAIGNNEFYDITYDGMHVYNASNCNFSNNVGTFPSRGNYYYYSNYYGIRIQYSNNCSVSDNDMRGGAFSLIYFYYSDECSAINNTVSGCQYGIRMFHTENSNVTGNEVYNSYDGISLNNGDNCMISDNIVYKNMYSGMDLYYSDTVLVSNNTSYRNGDGLYLYNSDGCTISLNTIYLNDDDGIYMYRSYNNDILNNTLSWNWEAGVRMRYSDGSTIANNTIDFNFGEGIYMYYTDFCTITNNSISRNGMYGIHLSSGSGYNTIRYNVLIGNIVGIYSSSMYPTSNTIEYNQITNRLLIPMAAWPVIITGIIVFLLILILVVVGLVLLLKQTNSQKTRQHYVGKRKALEKKEVVNILKMTQAGHALVGKALFRCPTCNKTWKDLVPIKEDEYAKIKQSLEKCTSCDSSNVELLETPHLRHSLRRRLFRGNVLLKYKCFDCKKTSTKIAPGFIIQRVYQEQGDNYGKKPLKRTLIEEVRLHCPACGALIKRGEAQNFCDQCGYDLQSLKPKTYEPKSTSYRKKVDKSQNSCPTCGNRVKLSAISPEKSLQHKFFRTHKGRIISFEVFSLLIGILTLLVLLFISTGFPFISMESNKLKALFWDLKGINAVMYYGFLAPVFCSYYYTNSLPSFTTTFYVVSQIVLIGFAFICGYHYTHAKSKPSFVGTFLCSTLVIIRFIFPVLIEVTLINLLPLL